MKCITVLLDGASDRSYKELNNMTPLQYAKTPNLDTIAGQSQCGLMTPLKEGLSLGTDLAHLLLFGYELKDYPNRSIIDAVGEGLTLNEDTLYLRSSFASVSRDKGYLLSSRFTPDFSDEEVLAVIDDLCMVIDGYSFECIHSYDSHGFVLVKGPFISDQISDSDPFRINQYVMKVEGFENDEKKVKEFCHVINKYIKRSYEILNEHYVNKNRLKEGKLPANIIMTKWAGLAQSLESFYIKNGMKGLLLGQSKLLMGLANYLSLDYKNYDSFDQAIDLALDSSADYIHLHTKDPDTASHKKDPFLKVAALEALDKTLEKLLNFDGLLIVTSDHSTPSSGQAIHSGESVAFMAKGTYVRVDDVQHFNEIACSKGSIKLHSSEFMTYIINATDRGSMYHLRQGSKKRHYILNEVNPL